MSVVFSPGWQWQQVCDSSGNLGEPPASVWSGTLDWQPADQWWGLHCSARGCCGCTSLKHDWPPPAATSYTRRYCCWPITGKETKSVLETESAKYKDSPETPDTRCVSPVCHVGPGTHCSVWSRSVCPSCPPVGSGGRSRISRHRAGLEPTDSCCLLRSHTHKNLGASAKRCRLVRFLTLRLTNRKAVMLLYYRHDGPTS